MKETASLSHLTLTAMAAKEAGMSYGQYVAVFGRVPAPEDRTESQQGAKTCPICGNLFYADKFRRNRKYCGPECAREAQYRQRRKRSQKRC